MNYSIILDEGELDNCINNFLPDLLPDEKYYMCLFARKKYWSRIKSDKGQLKRVVATKDRIKEKIRQMECQIGSYKFEGMDIPQEALAIYIMPNPRSMVQASIYAIKELVEVVTKPYNGYNPYASMLSAIQKSAGTRHFKDFDFDTEWKAEYRETLNNILGEKCYKVLLTKNGFHVIVTLNQIEKAKEKTWYWNMMNLPHIDVSGDTLIPIPGCCQGNFTPRLI